MNSDNLERLSGVRRTIFHTLHYYDFTGTPWQFVNLLQNRLDTVPIEDREHVKLTVGKGGTYFEAIYERPESDAEYQARVDHFRLQEERVANRRREHDHALYLKLKAQFEPDA